MGELTKIKVVKRLLGSVSTWGSEQPIRKAKGTGSFLQLARMAAQPAYLLEAQRSGCSLCSRGMPREFAEGHLVGTDGTGYIYPVLEIKELKPQTTSH